MTGRVGSLGGSLFSLFLAGALYAAVPAHRGELSHSASVGREGGQFIMTVTVENTGGREVAFSLPPGTPMAPRGAPGLCFVLGDGVDLALKPGASARVRVPAIPVPERDGSTALAREYEPSDNRAFFLRAARAASASLRLKAALRFRVPGDPEAGRLLAARWAIAELREDGWGLSAAAKKAAESEALEIARAGRGDLPAFWGDVGAIVDAARLGRADLRLGSERVLFDNTNIAGVLGGGASAEFVLERPAFITALRTYHWNNGKGEPKATWIAIAGAGEGPFKARAEEPPTWWKAAPMVLLQPGRYRIEDGDPSTWARNSESGGKGFVRITGRPVE